nr:hypothetical protein [Tanacetum cinerariifolium]GEY54727.1 hypothetical protein [Tanacetum cinerariifolium]
MDCHNLYCCSGDGFRQISNLTVLMTHPPLQFEGLPFEARMRSSPDYNRQPSNSFEWRKTIFGLVNSIGIRYAKPYTLHGGPSTKLKQSEDYDEEREIEPRPEPTRAATPPLRVASPRIHRRGERTVGFEGAQSRRESRVERNTDGRRPLEDEPRGNEGQSVNLPLLLAAHLGRGKNGQPLQSFLTSAYGGNLPMKGIPAHLPQEGHEPQTFANRFMPFQNGFTYPANMRRLRRRLEEASSHIQRCLEVSNREIFPSTVTSMKITDTIPMIVDTLKLRFKGL